MGVYDGAWAHGAGSETLVSRNPTTYAVPLRPARATLTARVCSGEELARVRAASGEQLSQAIDRATAAQRKWRSVPAPVRLRPT